jgi:MFS family permease
MAHLGCCCLFCCCCCCLCLLPCLLLPSLLLLQLLVGLFIVGFSMCIYFPAFMGYLTIIKQKNASAASSGQNAIMFSVTGTLVLAGAAITHALGINWYMTVLAVLHAVSGLAATVQIERAKARHRQLLGAVPVVDNGSAV